MKQHWQKVIIGVLCLLLFVLAIGYSAQSAKYEVLIEEHERIGQVLSTQTQLIVELRLRSVPKDFETLDALREWVNDWEIENKPIAVAFLNKTYVLSGNSELYSHYWDCDDISEAMQRDALKDGYLMSVCLIDSKGSVCDAKVSNAATHAGCMTATENAFWYIEPQTGEIVMIVGRD